MNQENNITNESPLETVQCKFNKWRESRTSKRKRIPDEPWNAAIDLTQKHSVNQVAKALRLNYTDLKKRMSQQVEPSSVQQHASSFVELDVQPAFAQPECVIEMEDKHGSKMKMAFRGQTNLDLVELTKSFWSKKS